MAWRIGLAAGIDKALDIPSQERDRDYVMVQPGGVLEVGYVRDNQHQIEALLSPSAWLWAKKI